MNFKTHHVQPSICNDDLIFFILKPKHLHKISINVINHLKFNVFILNSNFIL